MANYIKFYDTVTFEPIAVETSKSIKDFVNSQSGAKQPLIAKIAATHAGIITRNNGFYLPDRMRKGAASFTSQYNKPIQVHHNQDADPVGRVIKAEYVDITTSLKDNFIKKISDKFNKDASYVRAFADGKMPYIESVNFICDVLSREDSVLDNPDYQGLGFIKLTASITDPEAIQKILDGRYLTGSVGVTTNRAVCSVCKQDWTGDDGRCDHRPGKVYDGTKAFIITGDLNYDEYSFVNVPADRHSGVIGINVNGMTDSVTMDDSVGRTLNVNLDLRDSLSIMDSTSREEDTMTDLETFVASIKDKFAFLFNETSTITDFQKTLQDNWEVNKDNMGWEEFAIRAEETLDKTAIERIFAIDTIEKKVELLKVIRPYLDLKAATPLLTGTSADIVYEALNTLEWNDYSDAEDEEVIKYYAEHPEDAKLSTAQRKRLPGSGFCGPNRSFPVPDCAHVTAARRLIGRASVSASTKAKILACVSRKASAMSCDSSKDAVQETVVEEKIIEVVEQTTDAVVVELKKQLEELNQALEVTKTELTTVSAKLVDAEKKVTDHVSLDKDLENTRLELKLTQEDLTQMADQLVTSQENSIKLLADKLLTYKTLSGETVKDPTKFIDEVTAQGESYITDSIKELTGKVDMGKIADSINSGLARNPLGTVTDPVVNMQNNTINSDNSIKRFDKNTVSMVAGEYMRIKFGGNSIYGRGPDAADKYRKDMQSKGYIPLE